MISFYFFKRKKKVKCLQEFNLFAKVRKSKDFAGAQFLSLFIRCYWSLYYTYFVFLQIRESFECKFIRIKDVIVCKCRFIFTFCLLSLLSFSIRGLHFLNYQMPITVVNNQNLFHTYSACVYSFKETILKTIFATHFIGNLLLNEN